MNFKKIGKKVLRFFFFGGYIKPIIEKDDLILMGWSYIGVFVVCVTLCFKYANGGLI